MVLCFIWRTQGGCAPQTPFSLSKDPKQSNMKNLVASTGAYSIWKAVSHELKRGVGLREFEEGCASTKIQKKKCGWCGQIKPVYAYKEVDYEEVDHLPKSDLLIQGNQPLKDDDIVGIPQCRECYFFERGEEAPTKTVGEMKNEVSKRNLLSKIMLRIM